MPTYVYRREDGSTFEIEQRITEPALTHDPETGQAVQRVIANVGLLFKGSGFYLTDYARAKPGGKDARAERAEAKTDSDTASGKDKPAESKAPAGAAKETKTAPSGDD